MADPDPDPAPRRRRADAERNIARITEAARICLSADPEASVEDVAAAAGVGRMTVYGHFRTRGALVEAALAEALRLGEQTLETVDLTGDPARALTRLLASSWRLLAESSILLAAADGHVSAARVRELHATPAERVTALVDRGRREGVFRTDLPLTWLVSAIHYVLQGAAEEVRAGRLAPTQGASVTTATVQSLLAPPRLPTARRKRT
ncbi:TetR family transcriptional regulator [Nocardia sp. NPDC004568]|uniref:TetR/AcrR family transcriptional regulator n=1 Tax=Nocardia sp. NPDC004568 TaxID=3154551 RepID=UPI0033A6FC74